MAKFPRDDDYDYDFLMEVNASAKKLSLSNTGKVEGRSSTPSPSGRGQSPFSTTQNEPEKLNCIDEMKTTTPPQQNQQQKHKRSRRRKKVPTPKVQQHCDEEQEQRGILEKDLNNDTYPHEDEDDYPSSMGMTAVPSKETEHHDQKISGGSTQEKKKIPKRTILEELSFLKRISSTRCQVELGKWCFLLRYCFVVSCLFSSDVCCLLRDATPPFIIGFVPNMKVRAEIIVNDDLQALLVNELRESCSCCSPQSATGEGAFIPSLRQVANVAALPGIIGASLAMPDVHSGYGFCIGNVAAFDMADSSAVISPGGVGFDINCGVRLIRTNLTEADVSGQVREELADAMFRNIPVGVGVNGDIPCNMEELDKILLEGVNWAIEKGYAWEEDKNHCEDNGRMDTADPKCVSNRAKRRGLKQLGTLGAGNHYAEIQVVDEIYNLQAASTMGIGQLGQVCIMIHTGSRGLGHQVATDALTVMERAMARDHIELNDRQLSCARIRSREGKEYLCECD